ncbi:MAG: peptidase, partial [Brevibacterium sp.]|nr:peptidase [Brevibacterium sp.]MDN6174518.1 peptidase [Brevibacterium sp.]
MKTQRLATRAAAGTMILAFALTGCSNEESGAGQTSGDEGQAAETSEATEAQSETKEPSTSGSSGLAEDADLSKESPSVKPEDAIATAK